MTRSSSNSHVRAQRLAVRATSIAFERVDGHDARRERSATVGYEDDVEDEIAMTVLSSSFFSETGGVLLPVGRRFRFN